MFTIRKEPVAGWKTDRYVIRDEAGNVIGSASRRDRAQQIADEEAVRRVTARDATPELRARRMFP